MTYVLGPCPRPGCDKQHGVTVSKRGPRRAYTGAYVSPLRVSDEGSTGLVAEPSSVVLTGRPDRPGDGPRPHSGGVRVGQLRMEGLG